MATLSDFISLLQGASNAAASNLSAPVDGINWVLKKAGLPVSEKPIGGSEWLRQIGFTAEPKNANMGLLGEAVGGVLPMVVAAKAPQIAAKLNQAGQNLAAPRTLNPQTGAIVWHGSPHKFDKFDSSKIGTGEGAQAYGHGLYLAESPDVANEYRKQLSTKFQSGGLKFDGQANTRLGTTGNSLLDDYLVANLGDVNATRKQMLQDVTDIKKNNPQGAKEWQQALADLRKARASTRQTETGSLYKVDLPDEHIAKMLDWDKPLSQQAPEVQQTLKSLVDDVQSGGFDLSRGNRDLRKAFNPVTREQVLQEIATEYPHLKIVDGGLVEKSGRRIPDVAITEWMQNKHGAGYQDAGQLYRDLAHIVGSDAQVSATLKNNGIPGIRYLDGGSRGAGQGTSNFVIFPGNEGLLSILERNGQPLR